MELDVGNAGPILIHDRMAASLPHAPSAAKPEASFTLADGIPVTGPARISHLIFDDDIGASVFNH